MMLYTEDMPAGFKRSLVVSISIIAGSVAVAATVLAFLAGDISARAAKIAAARSAANNQTAELGSIAALKAQIPQAAAYRSAMEKLLPTQDGLIGFADWLRGAAGANQVVASVSFHGGNISPSANAPGQAGFSLVANGSLANLIAFVGALEGKSSAFLLAISSFDLVKNDSAYQLTAQGNLFFR